MDEFLNNNREELIELHQRKYKLRPMLDELSKAGDTENQIRRLVLARRNS